MSLKLHWAVNGVLNIGGGKFIFFKGEPVPQFLPQSVIDQARAEGFIDATPEPPAVNLSKKEVKDEPKKGKRRRARAKKA